MSPTLGKRVSWCRGQIKLFGTDCLQAVPPKPWAHMGIGTGQRVLDLDRKVPWWEASLGPGKLYCLPGACPAPGTLTCINSVSAVPRVPPGSALPGFVLRLCRHHLTRKAFESASASQPEYAMPESVPQGNQKGLIQKIKQ